MDPQSRNLGQLATALESACLNTPLNTFRNLIGSLPARFAAVRSAKDVLGHQSPGVSEGIPVLVENKRDAEKEGLRYTPTGLCSPL
ncbi:hypothetical protein CDAR_479151 [Caerostris darwini]|uniref:Uncharacterized protein n=1 Tax=Caerostris darwini TaxID=1538125 RepID=A0AAV4UWV1_9ARAC|nr:hypothetical protein CDAR_479151 [Caerostris darwini]